METKGNKEIDVSNLIGQVWKSKRTVIKWAIYGLVFGIVVAFSIPKQYTSIVKIAPENQSKGMSGSAGALASMIGVSTSTASDGIDEKVYPEIISSTPFLLEFAGIKVLHDDHSMTLADYIFKHQKKPWWSHIAALPSRAIGWISTIGSSKVDTATIEYSPVMQYEFASAMSAKIKSQLDPKVGVITIESTVQDPIIAKTITDSLVVKLQRYIVNYRTAKTRASLASSFKSLEEVKDRYFIAEELYARALDGNRNLISKRAEVAIEKLSNERNLTFQVYLQLSQQVETSKIKLQEETPIATIIEPATMPIRPSSPNKMAIIILWAFFGAFVAAATILIKGLTKQ